MQTYKVFLDSSNINCKPSSIISSKVYNYLQRNNHSIVNEPHRADYIIINTCGFSETFEDVSKALFQKYAESTVNHTKIISIGCLNMINENLRKDYSNIIFMKSLSELDKRFFLTVRFEDIQEAHLRQNVIDYLSRNTKRGFVLADRVTYKIMSFIYSLVKPIIKGTSKLQLALEEVNNENKFYVEISRGCKFNCKYCVIKKARGKIKSRGTEQILMDIDKVFEPNKNLCLIADDCGSYGIDINTNLLDLIYAINKKYPDTGIDLCYVNPFWIQKFESEFVTLFRKAKINSINIPMQSGSDKITKLMNRKYDVIKVLRIIEKIRHVSPQTLFWTHIIVGFPGEDHDDVRDTASMMEYFDFSYKFIYSDREGALSTKLANKISERVKRRRALYLRIVGFKLTIKKIFLYLR